MDLLLLVVASLVAVPLAVFWGGSPVSLVLGLVFALFSPGYALVAAVFPRRHDLDIVRCLALSFGLSIVVVPFIGVFFNYTRWGINLYSILLSLLAFIIVAAAVAWYRRHRLPPEERFEPRFRLPLSQFWGGHHLLDRALLVLLVVVTGVLTEAGRIVFEPQMACWIYIVHLSAVLCLFATFPYSKFAHLVYRTLAILKDLGMVEEHRLGEGHCHYEAVRSDPHYHFTCRGCGKVTEFDTSLVAQIEQELSEQEDVRVISAHLHLTGYCAQCKDKAGEQSNHEE